MSFSSDKPLFRPTWATVDLDALRYNYEAIKACLSDDVHVMAMVKADAYGHGAVPVSRKLENCGVRALGVATVEEGIELRDAGIEVPILVIGGFMAVGSPASKKMVEANLTPVIHSEAVLESLERDAASAGKKIGVHLKVDTGMSRLGARPESLDRILSKIRQCDHLFVEGVMTHLADAGEDDVSNEQYELFLSCGRRIESAIGKVPVWHIANSEAAMQGRHVRVPGATECWVRPGLALYGECEGVDPLKGRFRHVMGLVSRAVLLKYVPAGTRVSYCGIFVTRRKTRLAVVPIGYADGYPWSVTGSAEVLIRGRRFPVVGRVTMDMIVVDVTELCDIAINDEVVLLGRQGDEYITLRELARNATTIPYEILCGISKRMPRIYLDGDE